YQSGSALCYVALRRSLLASNPYGHGRWRIATHQRVTSPTCPQATTLTRLKPGRTAPTFSGLGATRIPQSLSQRTMHRQNIGDKGKVTRGPLPTPADSPLAIQEQACHAVRTPSRLPSDAGSPC